MTNKIIFKKVSVAFLSWEKNSSADIYSRCRRCSIRYFISIYYNDDDDDKMCNVFLISMYINCSICTGIFCCSSRSLRFVCAIRCTCGARLILNVSFESHNTPTEMENCVTTAQRIHFNLRCARVLLFFIFLVFLRCVSVCMWNVQHMLLLSLWAEQMPKETLPHPSWMNGSDHELVLPHRLLSQHCALKYNSPYKRTANDTTITNN